MFRVDTRPRIPPLHCTYLPAHIIYVCQGGVYFRRGALLIRIRPVFDG